MVSVAKLDRRSRLWFYRAKAQARVGSSPTLHPKYSGIVKLVITVDFDSTIRGSSPFTVV